MNWKPFAAAVVLVLAVGAADADALSWPWKRKSSSSSRKKLPTPIDSPIVRPKSPEHHKPGNRARHQSKYDRPEWGAQWEKTLNLKNPHKAHPWVLEGVR
ncbi:MAG TPA: hypothetical protein VFM29_10110 [Vicinamibacteria bacterium]|nr:hypothetical protein [Vicinamibacteria bacterium]